MTYLLMVLAVYLVPVIIISLILLFLRYVNSIEFNIMEVFIAFIPFCVWFLLLYFIKSVTKSLGNLALEIFICGIIGGLIQLPKIICVINNKKANKVEIISIVSAVLIVLSIFFLMPVLPE